MGKKRGRMRLFAFVSPCSPTEFKSKLREAVQDAGDLLYEDTPSGFDLGIERGGHSGGYWYVASLTETEGGTEMRGQLIYRSFHGDGEYRANSKWEDLREWFDTAVLFLLFLIPILIFYAAEGIARLVGKLRKRPVKWTMSTEEKLTHFMTEVMGCNTIE